MTDKQIRQNIMAIASRNGLDRDGIHQLMEGWGYGDSLRALDTCRLQSLRRDLVAAVQGRARSAPAEFDRQGRYFWHLAKVAGWSRERIGMLLLKRFHATHWNALDYDQRRSAIAMMQRYARSAQVKDMQEKESQEQSSTQ